MIWIAPSEKDALAETLEQRFSDGAYFRDRVFTEVFPGRTDLPKTLIFAKDDAHADDIVRLCREVFGKGNDFCKKITCKTTGAAPKALIAAFRNSYHPRVAVTVDMIATGTDIKPLEIVFFMRPNAPFHKTTLALQR